LYCGLQLAKFEHEIMFKKIFGLADKSQPSERKEPQFGDAPAAQAREPSSSTKVDAGKLATQAAELIKKLMMAAYTDERGVHLETILSAVSALAGYAGQRAALAMIEAGTAEAKQFPQIHEISTKNGQTFLVSELVNQLVASAGGPDRLTVFTLVANGGLRAGGKRLPEMGEIMRRNAEAIGSSNYPPLTVPQQHFPRENAITALRRWWPVVVKVFSVKELRSLHPIYHMFALGHIAMQVIESGKDVINPEIAVNLAMETAVAASKVTGIEADLST
jgi:hypothetical protein